MRTNRVSLKTQTMQVALSLSSLLLLVLLSITESYAEAPNFMEVDSLSYSRRGSPEPRPIEVQVRSQPRCMRGDLDVMMLDFQNSNRKSVLQMSVESLGAHRNVLAVGKIDPEFRPKRDVVGEFEVELPVFDAPTVLGVYLCAKPRSEDPEAPGPNAANPENLKSGCSVQEILPFDDLMRPHRVNTGKVFTEDGKLQKAPLLSRRLTGPSERVYFFRYVIAFQSTLYIPTESFKESDYELLQSYLSRVEADVKDSKKLVQRLKDDHKKLGSVPLAKTKRGIEITLPYYSSKKCGGLPRSLGK